MYAFIFMEIVCSLFFTLQRSNSYIAIVKRLLHQQKKCFLEFSTLKNNFFFVSNIAKPSVFMHLLLFYFRKKKCFKIEIRVLFLILKNLWWCVLPLLHFILLSLPTWSFGRNIFAFIMINCCMCWNLFRRNHHFNAKLERWASEWAKKK